MSPKRWEFMLAYSQEVFGQEPASMRSLKDRATAQGIPDIAITADVGRLLKLLVSTTPAKLVIEVGTLGGYSALWMAQALAHGGRLICVEINKDYADFARQRFHEFGVDDRISIRVGAGKDVLEKLAHELGPDSVDAVFLDAVKVEYCDYWKIARPMLKRGGLLLADNVYGSDDWWIDEESKTTRVAVDKFNRMVAGDADFTTVALPIRQGLLVARRH
ncbi:MAG TPA: O-methyltransferase [Phycisphaerales bacterium]|nr:O-methyltransferase [Phycisphaerales bacterium]